MSHGWQPASVLLPEMPTFRQVCLERGWPVPPDLDVPDGVRPHGLSKYNEEDCRCEYCKSKKAEHTRNMKQPAPAWEDWEGDEYDKPGMRRPNGMHGLTMYKNHGCRCDECKAAARAARQRLKHRAA